MESVRYFPECVFRVKLCLDKQLLIELMYTWERKAPFFAQTAFPSLSKVCLFLLTFPFPFHLQNVYEQNVFIAHTHSVCLIISGCWIIEMLEFSEEKNVSAGLSMSDFWWVLLAQKSPSQKICIHHTWPQILPAYMCLMVRFTAHC